DSFVQVRRNAAPATVFPTVTDCPVFEVSRIPEQYLIEGCRTLSLGLIAVEQALAEARLDDLSGYRVGVCMGTTVASQLNDLQFYRSYRQQEEVSMVAVI
ncbi:MAG: beta-ketoacyl-[acyl-carrier-protein] synthase family protein, partial [Deltaproteobacteria bacterium]|nr:beta-ketoacyl-[acyl-carrier-protein] synthase family protein [Deltaproteobacteria bacterium]